ncbi:gibberellin-regulated protein 1-like [Fagus crenata]
MAISKALIASILIALLVIHLVEADQLVNTNAKPGSPKKQIGDYFYFIYDGAIVEQHVLLGVNYHLGQTCARGHVGLAVLAAAVFHQALPVIVMYAPATPP